ncbi:MAG: HD domain-containing protein [Deltaproteobacteria bacterium]|nr:HD domain-containing protein [Deltaproteobacteria bacterium]
MYVRDPVHGLVTFETDEEQIVPRLLATPEVQRLRRIRQLGLTCLAFPGAEHTRFAHALGAAHVMQLLVARLRRIDGELPFWQRLTSDRARDAIAAALLHDVGHGPLSHLFEEAVAGFGDRIPDHEQWTERILLDPSTGVHRVLAQHDPELPRRAAELVHGRHELPYLAHAVSGTFDVDRCDYLLRDAHATGARYGEFDLHWLLRSLRFGQHATGEPPGLAIDGTKGLSAIESFVLARLFMFQQIYFHKATRAAEWMIRTIFSRAIRLLRDGGRLPTLPAALRAFAVGDAPSVADYLNLDDHLVMHTIATWQDASDPVLADLCRRLRGRQLFKSVELFAEEAEPARREAARETVAELAREAGLDAEIYTGLDVADDVPYGDDESLRVLFPRGPARRPAEVSFVLGRLRGERLTRARVVFAPELRDRVRQVLWGGDPGAGDARGTLAVER